MKLELRRTSCGKVCTIGELWVDGKFECYTLEDVVRVDGVKVYGETAIPKGTYDVQVTYSPRFQRDLPLLINVKGFVGIRIHPGNTAKDTDGCLLVGTESGMDMIYNSRKAFTALFAKINMALAAKQKVTIRIA